MQTHIGIHWLHTHTPLLTHTHPGTHTRKFTDTHSFNPWIYTHMHSLTPTHTPPQSQLIQGASSSVHRAADCEVTSVSLARVKVANIQYSIDDRWADQVMVLFHCVCVCVCVCVSHRLPRETAGVEGKWGFINRQPSPSWGPVIEPGSQFEERHRPRVRTTPLSLLTPGTACSTWWPWDDGTGAAGSTLRAIVSQEEDLLRST